jgi:phage major head subunit gpT-like protein
MPVDINSAAARLRLRENYKVVTLKAMHAAPPSVAKRICQAESSSAAVEVYDMLVQLPVMRNLADKAKVQPTGKAQFRIENQELEATVAIRQAALERGEASHFNNRFEMLGIAVSRRPDRVLASVMTSGFTVNDYTETPFFSADKPHIPGVVGMGTFTNLMTEKPSAGSWEKAKQLLAYIKDPNGEPYGLGENLVVVCSTKYASTMKKVLKAETITEVVEGEGVTAVSNIYAGDATLIEFKHLNTAAHQDKWFVLDLSLPVRAFIDQTETQPQFYAQDDPNTHKDAFEQHVFNYQAYQRAAVGFGLPQLAVGSTGAADAL